VGIEMLGGIEIFDLRGAIHPSCFALFWDDLGVDLLRLERIHQS
jgi:hypothetical protein